MSDPIPQQALATAEGLRPQIVDLLVRGKAIKAIKLVRQHTGLSLEQAKDVVQAISAQERIDPRARRR